MNQLAETMPGEFAIAATGHDLTHTSAFYEYMNPTVAMIQPAANVLSNWSPPPFGQLGHGPKAPTLDCLSESDRENVKKVIEIMWLNERFPHYMTRSGRLWPMMEAAMAALIMYYEERFKDGEMSTHHEILLRRGCTSG